MNPGGLSENILANHRLVHRHSYPAECLNYLAYLGYLKFVDAGFSSKLIVQDTDNACKRGIAGPFSKSVYCCMNSPDTGLYRFINICHGQVVIVVRMEIKFE